jgi:adenylate cyclase
MKYRAKLYFALAGTAFVSSLSGLLVLFYEFRDHAFAEEQARVTTVAATTAALINPNLIKEINTLADEHSLAYAELKKSLIKARDANRRQNIYIRYLYAIKPNPDNPSQFIYVVDTEENPRETTHIGEVDESIYISDFIHHLQEYYSPDKFIADPWGVWVSGYAPVYDQSGTYVGTVVADISMQRYLFDAQRVVQLFSLGFLVSLLFALAGGYLLAKSITLSLSTLLFCVREIGQGNLKCHASLQSHDEFEELANEINNMTHGLQERERLKLNFTRYVSQYVMEKILSSESVAKLEGERRKITVLFSDIRQFTQLAENMPPEEVVALLNEYFEAMLDVIFHYQGTLDKFLGDGIMVEFGAPLDDEMQEKHSVMTAIGMQQELSKLLKKWKSEGKPQIEIGIGIHTGLAIVGNIGSEKRVEYTAIGDTVNVAARLEQETKRLKKPILLSESTYSAVKDQFKASNLGPMILPGRKEAIVVYSLDIEPLT